MRFLARILFDKICSSVKTRTFALAFFGKNFYLFGKCKTQASYHSKFFGHLSHFDSECAIDDKFRKRRKDYIKIDCFDFFESRYIPIISASRFSPPRFNVYVIGLATNFSIFFRSSVVYSEVNA